MTDQSSAGWHPAPDRPGQLRWYDGRQWTDQYAPAGGAPAPGFGGAPAGPPRTDAMAVVALVLGFFPCLSLGSIVLGFVSRGRITRSQGALKGKGLATVGIVLGFLWLLGGIALFALGASGTLEDENVDRFPDGEEREIAELVDRTEEVFEDREVQEWCDELITPEYRAGIDEIAGSCTSSFSDDDWRPQADMEVRSIDITGETATAQVDQKGDRLVFSFAQVDGQWRISNLSIG